MKDDEGRRISRDFITTRISPQPRSIEQDNANNNEWQPRVYRQFVVLDAAKLSTGPQVPSDGLTLRVQLQPTNQLQYKYRLRLSRQIAVCVALLGAVAPFQACDWWLPACDVHRVSDSTFGFCSSFRVPRSVRLIVMSANTNNNDNDNPPDSLIDPSVSLQYWNSVDADVNGMLGGYPQISRVDLRGSANFLAKVRRLIPALPPSGPLKLGVDCGAGIGRVTDGFLSKVCEVVDVVEPVENFASVIRDGPLKKDGKVEDIYTMGLETWIPSKRYDLMWIQWCVGHLTDAQLVECFSRCREALSDVGLIVLKENISTDPDGEDIYDDLDSSVTRTDHKYRVLFKDAGLNLVKTEEQSGFPSSLKLFPVRFYALRPAI